MPEFKVKRQQEPRNRQDIYEACWRYAMRIGMVLVKLAYVGWLIVWTVVKGIGKGLIFGGDRNDRL